MSDREPAVRVQGRLQRLTIYIGEPHRAGHHPLHQLLQHATQMRLAGGTVFVGCAGFGHGGRVHEPHLWHASDESPASAVFVDDPQRIAELLPVLRALLPTATVSVEEVTTIRYLRPHRH